MLVVWAAVAASRLIVTALASTRGVQHAAKAAAGLGVSPFVVGFTLLAIGTDMPEIAKSVASSLAFLPVLVAGAG